MALPINLVLLCNKKIGTKTKFLSPYSVCFLGASLKKVNSRVNEVTSTCYVFNEDGDIEAPYTYMHICKMAGPLVLHPHQHEKNAHLSHKLLFSAMSDDC